jgi:DNA-binding beta-propeller fold protein YncE
MNMRKSKASMKTNSSLAALSLCVILNGATARAAETYHFIKDIPVGGSAQWDYLKVDSEAHRLYLSHGTKVEVIDLDKGTVIGSIENTPGVHGIALAPKLGRAFTSNGQENKASIVDLKTLKTIMKVTTGANPDSILYEPVQNEVYTFNGKGKSATAFDPESGKVIATIDLGGKPESATADSQAGRLFVNIEDKSEVVVIDAKAHKVLNHWPIAPGETASGMAIDLEHHRLFLGCDNKKMVMMDSSTGKVLATVPIGAGVDANAFDPGTQLAFSSNGEEGTTTIAKELAPARLTVVQTLKTVVGARTMALDPQTHNIYLPAPTPAFRVLVYGMDKQ